jgi:hypothetical protein
LSEPTRHLIDCGFQRCDIRCAGPTNLASNGE